MPERTKHKPLVSFVVPIFNEAAGLIDFHESLLSQAVAVAEGNFEIIYCDDGSEDDSVVLISDWNKADPRVKLLAFSRNFGKESALSAGIAATRGQAIMMLDGDGQHPVELIPEFVNAWKEGARVVVGIRTSNDGQDFVKRASSKMFYRFFNLFAAQKLAPGSTDFRLIDESVREAFLTLTESERITRGLIDWLGFSSRYIPFKAHVRQQGQAGYSLKKLMKLATNSFTSLTPRPLYMFGYIGVGITILAFGLGIAVIIEQLILGDPLHWNFTGTAMLAILLLFLVGIILLSQGVLALYVAALHAESKNRPLYIIDHKTSRGI